jgi:hypothetical protein
LCFRVFSGDSAVFCRLTESVRPSYSVTKAETGGKEDQEGRTWEEGTFIADLGGYPIRTTPRRVFIALLGKMIGSG